VALLIGLGAREAAAARRSFAWVWDTDVVPERVIELEWWLTERARYPQSEAVLTVSTVVGLLDTLELAIPVEASFRPGIGTQLEDYGVDLRWRLMTADAAQAGPLVVLLRAGVRRVIPTDSARLEGDAVLSFEPTRAVRAVADVGGYGTTVAGGGFVLTYGAGVSYAFTDELRAGVELYGERSWINGDEDGWLSVGPNLALTHGRFWLTAALTFGIDGDAPGLLPRIIWAAAF
jgi:hypothetical protein